MYWPSLTGILLLLAWATCRSASAIRLQCDPFDKLPMKSVQDIGLRLSFNEITDEMETWPSQQEIVLTFQTTDPKSWVVELLNDSLTFGFEMIKKRSRQALTIRGEVVGVQHLRVLGHIINTTETNPMMIQGGKDEYRNKSEAGSTRIFTIDMEYLDDMLESDVTSHMSLLADEKVLLGNIKVMVTVQDRMLHNMFTAVLSILLILNTINMGSQLDPVTIMEVFKKPIGPAVGFCSQFLLMPLVSFGVGWLMTDDILFRIGLFVLGCCPGGTVSNFWCILLGGNVDLSVTMTFISTVAALGMMPFWLWTLGSFLSDEHLVIPFGKIIFSLILIMAAAFMVSGAGFVFGAVLAWLFRLDLSQIKAVSVETAFQNGKIAFIVLQLSLPEPYCDLATIAPAAQVIVTGTILWPLLAGWKCFQRLFCNPKRKEREHMSKVEEELDEELNLTKLPKSEDRVDRIQVFQEKKNLCHHMTSEM